jgi:hypothetical protein
LLLQIRQEFGVSNAEAFLLTAIPAILMGLERDQVFRDLQVENSHPFNGLCNS